VFCRGVELGYELAVRGAGGGQVVASFFELEEEADDLLLQLADLLVEGVDVGGCREPCLRYVRAPSVFRLTPRSQSTSSRTLVAAAAIAVRVFAADVDIDVLVCIEIVFCAVRGLGGTVGPYLFHQRVLRIVDRIPVKENLSIAVVAGILQRSA
jgi:hypothetical protein